VPARAVLEIRARDGTFFSRFLTLFSSLSVPLSLSCPPSPDRSAALSSSRVSRYRGLDSRDIGLLRRPKSQRANRPRRITGFRSPLRAIPNNGSNGSDVRAPRFAPLSSAFRPDLAPTLTHSIFFSLLRRDLRPLRFNLTRHYYVFHRDSLSLNSVHIIQAPRPSFPPTLPPPSPPCKGEGSYDTST